MLPRDLDLSSRPPVPLVLKSQSSGMTNSKIFSWMASSLEKGLTSALLEEIILQKEKEERRVGGSSQTSTTLFFSSLLLPFFSPTMSDSDHKTSEKGEQGVIPIVQVNTLDSDHKNQGGAAVEESSFVSLSRPRAFTSCLSSLTLSSDSSTDLSDNSLELSPSSVSICLCTFYLSFHLSSSRSD